MTEIPSSIEDMIFEIMDRFKFIFFPEKWSQFFLDYSKNEIFIMLYVYRRNQANMTEISEYMNIPLNTVTGVVNRLEKKELIFRERSREDKRVVTICLTEHGRQFLGNEITQLGYYFSKAMKVLTEEEKATLFGAAEKVFQVLQQEDNRGTPRKNTETHVRKIVIE